MAPRVHRFSVFSQTLDRVAFIAYFLGAVIPLCLLATATQRWVLPTFEEGLRLGVVAALVGTAILSLGSFLMLRRVTRQTLSRMSGDNERLQVLVQVSGALAEAPHSDALNGVVAQGAAGLTGARAAFVVRPKDEGGAPELVATSGKDGAKLYDALGASIEMLVDHCLAEGSTGEWSCEDRSAPRIELKAAAGVPLKLADGTSQGAVLVVHTEAGHHFERGQIDSLSTLATLASVALHNVELRDAQKNFFAHMTDILVTALDSQLDLQTGHSRRVAQFSNVMGRALGLDQVRLERLHFAALLHDVGMLRIDQKLRENKKACQKHPQLGFRMLERIKLWEKVAPVVLHHHEWWNGEGYPEGLAGEDIPLEARIIGIAEAFDSMTSATSYRVPVTVPEALDEVRRCAGTQFDPEVARIFLELAEKGSLPIEPS